MCTGHADSMFTRSDCACFMAPNRTISTGCSNYLIRITWRTNNRFLDFAIRVLRSRLCRVGFTCDNDFFWFFICVLSRVVCSFQLLQWGKSLTWRGLCLFLFVLYAGSRVHCAAYTRREATGSSYMIQNDIVWWLKFNGSSYYREWNSNC